MARERMVGVITVVHSTPGAFTDEHLALIQSISDQAGQTILNARLYAESQRQARVMTALAETAATTNASLRLDEVLQRIMDQTCSALRVEAVLLTLIDETQTALLVRAVTGETARPVLGVSIPMDTGVIARVAREGRGVIISREKAAELEEKLAKMKLGAFACAPVHVQGTIIGVLIAVNPVAGAFDGDALLVLTGIGSLAGTAIHNAQLYEQLQATHKRYHELFEDSVDPILITDLQGKILEANRRAIRTSGRAPENLLNLTIGQLHQLQPEKVGPALELISGDETISYESFLHIEGRDDLPVEVHVRRVRVEGSDSLQWILRDISEHKALDILRDDLIAMIYHDLRSPLANVVSSLDILTSMLPPDSNPSLSAVLNIAIRSTERIQRLISSLLDVHRLEAGQAIASQKSTDLAGLVQESLEVLRPVLDGKGQKISVDLEENLPPVWVDADMIRRVLINLLDNAAKYSPSGSNLALAGKRDPQAADLMVRIWISDNGPGIPQEQQRQIFNKFTRLRPENGPKGLGLGLAFCRMAVEAHGGRIWVESQPGSGSRFFFTLPQAQDPA